MESSQASTVILPDTEQIWSRDFSDNRWMEYQIKSAAVRIGKTALSSNRKHVLLTVGNVQFGFPVWMIPGQELHESEKPVRIEMENGRVEKANFASYLPHDRIMRKDDDDIWVPEPVTNFTRTQVGQTRLTANNEHVILETKDKREFACPAGWIRPELHNSEKPVRIEVQSGFVNADFASYLPPDQIMRKDGDNSWVSPPVTSFTEVGQTRLTANKGHVLLTTDDKREYAYPAWRFSPDLHNSKNPVYIERFRNGLVDHWITKLMDSQEVASVPPAEGTERASGNVIPPQQGVPSSSQEESTYSSTLQTMDSTMDAPKLLNHAYPVDSQEPAVQTSSSTTAPVQTPAGEAFGSQPDKHALNTGSIQTLSRRNLLEQHAMDFLNGYDATPTRIQANVNRLYDAFSKPERESLVEGCLTRRERVTSEIRRGFPTTESTPIKQANLAKAIRAYNADPVKRVRVQELLNQKESRENARGPRG
jgi:hypothetical protein